VHLAYEAAIAAPVSPERCRHCRICEVTWWGVAGDRCWMCGLSGADGGPTPAMPSFVPGCDLPGGSR